MDDAQLGELTAAEPGVGRAARRGADGSGRGRRRRRPRAGARALPGPQEPAHRDPALYPDAAARAAARRRHGSATWCAPSSRRWWRRARRSWPARSLRRRWPTSASTSRCPASRFPLGHEHLIARPSARSRTSSSASATRSPRVPRSRLDYYNFTALNTPPKTIPRARSRHVLRRLSEREPAPRGGAQDADRGVLLRTHTSPVQVRAMESQRAARLHHLPRQGLPARPRRHAHADVPPGRGPGRRRGHHPGRPQGHAAPLRARVLRRRPR